MSLYLCPICRGALISDGRSLRCHKNHTFDFASAGYVNLLRSKWKKGAVPGDNREMCASRNQFLSKGYYQNLAQGLSEYLTAHSSHLSRPTVVDAACGEGYYTAAFYQALAANGRKPQIAGIDISKYALKYAGKRQKEVEFAAASVFDLPLADQAADFVTDIFAPVAPQEFLRILKPGGLFLLVGPGPCHLWELKQFLYRSPYPNDMKEHRFPGFTAVDRFQFDCDIFLNCHQDIWNLFTMTPYYWKTPAEAVQRLKLLSQLRTKTSFVVHVFRAD